MHAFDRSLSLKLILQIDACGVFVIVSTGTAGFSDYYHELLFTLL